MLLLSLSLSLSIPANMRQPLFSLRLQPPPGHFGAMLVYLASYPISQVRRSLASSNLSTSLFPQEFLLYDRCKKNK